MRAAALPPAPAVQDRCPPRCPRLHSAAGPLPALLSLLVLLAAASPAAGTIGPLPVRPAQRRLFSLRAAGRRFRLFAAADPSSDASGRDQAAPTTPPLSGPTTSSPGEPAHPGVPVGAQLPDGPVQLTKRIGHDLRDLVVSPFHAKAHAWEALAGGVVLVGLSHLVDADVRTAVLDEGSDSQSWAKTIRPLGQEGGLALAALAWGAGEATGHRKIAATAEDSLEATIVAAGFVSPLLKVAVGRDRPRSGLDKESFSGGESFPSGEATQAFAMASVIAAHSQRPWVDALAWSGAAAVSWERLRLDAHWASDVAAGALIGTGIGRWVVRRNRPRLIERPDGMRTSFLSDWSVTPLLGQRDFGLGFRIVF